MADLEPMSRLMEKFWEVFGLSSAQPSDSDSETTDDPACARCKDHHWLWMDREVGDPEFSKLVRCPDCGPERERTELAQRVQKVSAECGLSEHQRTLHFSTFTRYAGNEQALDGARKFAANNAGREWLVIAGRVGNGKTHLLAAIANEAIAAGVPTLYAYVPDLLDWLRSGYGQKQVDEDQADFLERLDRVRRVPLLLLDDLAAERRTPWGVETLESIFDYRYREQLALAATTNANVDLVRDLSERIHSRIKRYDYSSIVLNSAVSYDQYRQQAQPYWMR